MVKTGPTVKKNLLREGHALRKEIVTGIRNQAPGGKIFRALAPSTVKAKKSSKALMDHGDLVRSVNVTKLEGSSGYAVFVGVHRKEVTKDGDSMANLAEIHEYGSVKVPDHPPARPFLNPSYDVWYKGSGERFFNGIQKDLGTGALGIAMIKMTVRTGTA